jgi:hypothetical protein
VALIRNGGNAAIPAATGTLRANLGLLSDTPEVGRAPESCTLVYNKSMGHHWTRVGQTYIPGTNHATARFVYLRGQTSSLGIGVSASGNFGSYSTSGTLAWGTTYRQPFRTNRPYASWWYYTQFHWAKYANVCAGHFAGWQVQVNGYWGGAQRGGVNKFPRTPAKWCAHFQAGDGPTINTTVAVTWGEGATLPEIGFNVEATTGYDTSGEIQFGLTAGRWLCGQHGPPGGAGGAPRQIVVRVRRP